MNKNTHGHVMPEHRRQRWALRKLSVGMCSVLLGFAVMIPTVPAVAAAEIFAVSDADTAHTGVRELDTSSHFTAGQPIKIMNLQESIYYIFQMMPFIKK